MKVGYHHLPRAQKNDVILLDSCCIQECQRSHSTDERHLHLAFIEDKHDAIELAERDSKVEMKLGVQLNIAAIYMVAVSDAT